MTDDQTITRTDGATLQAVLQRITKAWADNDAAAFANAFAENGSMILPGDVYLTSREEIRSFMQAAFAGPYHGTSVTGQPLSLRVLGDGVAVLVTLGGVVLLGDTEVTPEQAIRATWVVTRQNGEWLISAYHNSRINQA